MPRRAKEEDMGEPRACSVVAEVSVFRQHEGIGARFRRFEVAAGEFGSASLDQLLPRGARESPLGALEDLWQLAAYGWRVVAIRCAVLGIPELGFIEASCPGAFDEADETVLALHRRLIAVPAEHEYLGVRRDGRRRGAACQCDFIIAVGDEVLLGRSHNGIRILRSLRSRRSTPAQCGKEGRGENRRGLSSISHCSPLGKHREASFPCSIRAIYLSRSVANNSRASLAKAFPAWTSMA